MVESTYADSLHPPADDVERRLAELLEYIDRRNSKLLIPAFFRRAYAADYLLSQPAGRERTGAKDIKVYIDSPLSQKATRIYADHREVYNEEAKRMLAEGKDPLTFPGMTFIGTPEESMALNDAPGPMIIIAASGM